MVGTSTLGETTIPPFCRRNGPGTGITPTWPPSWLPGPSCPDAIRTGIVAMVKAARSEHPRPGSSASGDLTNHPPGLHVHDRAALENALSADYSLPSEAFRTSLDHSRPALRDGNRTPSGVSSPHSRPWRRSGL